MLWCCKQEWFQKALGERHPNWPELGQLWRLTETLFIVKFGYSVAILGIAS
jgi:hypothetical protein